MPFPSNIYATRRLRLLAGLALFFSVVSASLFARGPAPTLRISLESVGFEPPTEQFLLSGSSMLSLHYVDNQHLLLTFRVHRLMERIVDDPPEDEDRVIEAVLLETPSGRVLARTDWRLHDAGQYLWDLDHGKFLLRVRNTLTTFAPMANLSSGQPFRQRPFLTTARHIGALLISPEADLLVVESIERMPQVSSPTTPLFGPTPKPNPPALGGPDNPEPVMFSFYRLSTAAGGDEVKATLAGIAHANNFGGLAATGAGHMAVVDQGQQHWAFDFHPFRGKVKELSPFDSSCRPTPQFVSSSEFVSFGCHGGNNPQVLGGFNLHGEEMWEQNLSGDFIAPSFVFAPSSGRFALGRVLSAAGADYPAQIPAEALTGQSVVVYQTESGQQLLRVDCWPVARAGQNFTLSPDGMSLAVLYATDIDIYSLPSLSAKDRAAVKEARALVPQENLLPIDWGAPSSAGGSAAQATSQPATVPDSNAAASTVTTASPDVPKPAPPAAPATTTAQPTANTAPNGDAAGDAAPEQPRKPPTLYTLPTDPEDKQDKQDNQNK